MRIILFIIISVYLLFPIRALAVNYCNDSSIVSCYPAQENSGTTLVDHSSNGFNGTFGSSGHPAWQTSAPSRSYLTYSLNYSSSSDLINLGTNDTTTLKPGQPFSFVGWFNLSSDTSNGGSERFFSRNSGTESEFITVVTKGINFTWAGTGGPGNVVVTSSNNTWTINTWFHLAITGDGSVTATNYHIYVNGVEVGYITQSSPSTVNNETSANLYLGNRADGTRWIPGNMTEVAFFKRALSSSEISDIYNNGLLQSTPNGAIISSGIIKNAIIN